MRLAKGKGGHKKKEGRRESNQALAYGLTLYTLITGGLLVRSAVTITWNDGQNIII